MRVRSVFRIAVACVATLSLAATRAPAQSERGDVNGDGRIDGVDALYVLQQVKGTLILTAEQKARADVYPMPGKDGRVVGDGQVVEQDALRLLQHAIGLVTRAELTGDFDGPFLSEFEPESGGAGTRVTLRGVNFSAAAGENLVKLGERSLAVSAASSTELAVVVPEGAESATFTVTTPGGTAASGERFVVTQTQTGALSVPAGLDVSSYTVVSPYGTAVPDAQGRYSVPSAPDTVSLLMAVPPEGDPRILLNMDLGQAAGRQQPASIDVLSTARSLIFLSPLFIARDPTKAEWLMKAMEGEATVQALADALTTAFAKGGEPLDDAGVQEALDAAILALADKLSKEMKLTEGETRAPSRAAALPESVRLLTLDMPTLDANILWHLEDEMQIRLQARYGQPLDWMVRVKELDVSSYPEWSHSIVELPLRQGYRYVAGGADITSNVPGRAFFSAWDALWLICELTGYTSRDIRLPANHDAAYLIRAYNGAFASSSDMEGTDGFEDSEYEFLLQNTADLPGGIALARVAAGVNVVNVVRDVLAIAGCNTQSKKPLITSIALWVINYATKNPDKMKTPSGVLQLFIGALGHAVGFPTRSAGTPSSRGIGEPFKRAWGMIGKLWGACSPSVSAVTQHPIYKTLVCLSSGGRIAEVLYALGGTSLGGNLSPMETALVVVGDPFSPRITEYPKTVVPGSEITIKGIRLAPKAADNKVFFGSLQGVTTSASADGTEIKARVPAMGPGDVKLGVRTTRGVLNAGPVTVVRAPLIIGIKPDFGYAAGATWQGQIHPGTQVVVSGSYFGYQKVDGKPTLEDKLFFRQGEGWLEAAVDLSKSSTTQLVANVPKGATSGFITVRTPDDRYAWSPTSFYVLDKPVVDGTRPAEARAGDTVELTGSGFYPSLKQTIVEFTAGGQTYPREPWYLGADYRIGAPMPGEIPEGATAEVVVRTPAGVSNALSVKRVAGRAAGTRLVPAVVAEVKPDGVLSVPEAIKLVQSSLDIFATPEGWDDADATVLVERTEITAADTGNLVDVRTTGKVLSRETRGHAGTEVARVTTKVYEQRGAQAPFLKSQDTSDVSLDNPTISAIGPLGAADLPGIGKVEEGDAVTDLRWGKDFVDTVWISPDGASLAFDLVLDQAAAGGDIVRFTSEGTITGNVVVSTHDNTVEVYDSYLPSLAITGKLEITGSRNTLRKLAAAGGVVLQGSSNTLVVSAGGTSRIAGGVDIGSGAVGNHVGATTDNCDVGIRISGGAQTNVVSPYVTNCKIGLLIAGETTQANRVQDASTARIGYNRVSGNDVPAPCENGVIIADGAHDNVVEVNVKYCTADGVVIMGAGTSRNRFAGDVWSNGGNGISILDGPTGNTLGFTDKTHASSMTSGGHGIYIRGNGTNGNEIRGLNVSRNGKAGIFIEGATGAMPQGTLITESDIRPHPDGGVLMRDLQPAAKEPCATVRNCTLDGPYSGAPPGPGIVLENTGGALLDGNRMNLKDNRDAIEGCVGSTVGILLKGVRSNGNVSRLDAIGVCSTAGIQITGGAWGNRIENAYVAAMPGVGILVEGGGKENQIVWRPEMNRDFGGLAFWGGVVTGVPSGIVVRGGCTATLIDGYKLGGCADSVVIEGPDTVDTTVTASQLKRLIARKGALRTTIGSSVADAGCQVLGSAAQGVLIQDAATKGVTLLGSVLGGAQQEAVLIEGAQDVQIGSPDGPNHFLDTLGAASIRIVGGGNIRVAGNKIEGTTFGALPAAGVRVEGGATGVTIGGATPKEGNLIRHHVNQVHVTGAGTTVAVSNNTLGDAGRAGQAVGILVDGGAQGLRVERNTITRQQTSGIQVSGAGTSGVTILRNQISGNDGNGITTLGGAGKLMAGGNTLRANGGFGVSLGAGTGPNTVIEGSIYDNRKGGIEADQPAAPKVLLVRSGAILGEVPLSVDSGTLVQVYADNGLQGRKFLGYTRVRGKAWRLEAPVPAGMGITATVTDPSGSTSSFGDRGWPATVPALSGQQVVAFTSTRDSDPEIYLQVPGDDPARLTNSPGADHSPAVSRDGGKIAFVSERSGNPEIWVMGADGSAPAQRTNSPGPDYEPAWSPDGKKLAFVSERDGNPEVYVMDGEGSGVTRLTNSPGADRHPCWSPDGSKIAFTSNRAGNADVWVMNADGSGAAALPGSPQADYDPAWSPDGARLAFVSERDGNPEVYLMGADGSSPLRLTETVGADVEPAWSPDGEWVAFTSAQAGDAELFARQVGPGRLERLTVSLGVNGQPSWSGAAGGRLAASRR